jgi:hypothetical protein
MTSAKQIESGPITAKDPEKLEWNKAQRSTRRYLRGGLKHRILLNYHDFYHRNEACVPLISRFLNLGFDERILRSWAERSARFEERRREKAPLTDEQIKYMEKHKDHETEKFVLASMEEQWEELELTPGEIVERRLRERGFVASESGADEQIEALERGLKTERVKTLRKRNELLEEQLRDIRESRVWRLLGRVKDARTRLFGRRS